jgi:hypothetical protein
VGRPLASDPDFSSIMINPVRAPTRNRHYLASSGSLKKVVAAGNEITIASTDTMTADVIDALRTKLDSMPLPPQGVRFDGDQAADDAPLRVLLVSSEQYTSIVQSTNFRTFQANAMARAGMAKNHPDLHRRGRPVERHPDRQDAQADPVLRRRQPALVRLDIEPHRDGDRPRARRRSARPSPSTAPSCSAARRWAEAFGKARKTGDRTSGRRRNWTTATSWRCSSADRRQVEDPLPDGFR